MAKYIITNTVQAESITRLEYHIYMGLKLQDDGDSNDEGYLIINESGNESWQPKELFESSAVLISGEE